MGFNELNSVEYFVIHRLTGVNLNEVKSGTAIEQPVDLYDSDQWR